MCSLKKKILNKKQQHTQNCSGTEEKNTFFLNEQIFEKIAQELNKRTHILYN